MAMAQRAQNAPPTQHAVAKETQHLPVKADIANPGIRALQYQIMHIVLLRE